MNSEKRNGKGSIKGEREGESPGKLDEGERGLA